MFSERFGNALSQYPDLSSLFKVTPGIQPLSMVGNDQRRTMTPAEAIKLGASALVVGRAITGSDNPGEAARRIMEEIGEAMVAV
jgi:orotidine-5'-phosphate decarboxylase